GLEEVHVEQLHENEDFQAERDEPANVSADRAAAEYHPQQLADGAGRDGAGGELDDPGPDRADAQVEQLDRHQDARNGEDEVDEGHDADRQHGDAGAADAVVVDQRQVGEDGSGDDEAAGDVEVFERVEEDFGAVGSFVAEVAFAGHLGVTGHGAPAACAGEDGSGISSTAGGLGGGFRLGLFSRGRRVL